MEQKSKKQEISIKDIVESQDYLIKRQQIQSEININKVNINRDEFKKSDYEKKQLKKYKQLDLHKSNLEIMQAFAKSKTPNWGSFNFKSKEVLINLRSL